MLRTILSNQELIMKALKIEIPAKKISPNSTKKTAAAPVKKATTKKVVGKTAVKKAK